MSSVYVDAATGYPVPSRCTNQEALLLEALRAALAELDDERYEREIWEGAAVGAWKRGDALKAERDRYRATLVSMIQLLVDAPFNSLVIVALRIARKALAPAIPPRVTDADFEALADVRREVEQSRRKAEAIRRELELDAPDGEKVKP
jgi:hypothetical protein